MKKLKPKYKWKEKDLHFRSVDFIIFAIKAYQIPLLELMNEKIKRTVI